MAGSKGQSGSNNARIVRTEAYAEKIRRMFAETVNEILELNRTLPDIASGVMYSFDGDTKRVQAKVEMLLRRLHSSATLAIKEGVAVEWEQANLECDKLVKSTFGQEVLSSSEFAAWRKRNTDARDAFINRSEKGLNLSDRVWKSVRQLRDEMEVAITVSVGDGTSARNISRQVRQYLNDPDLMFRRFRYKKGEKDIIDPETGDVIGKQPVYGLKWKKRIKGEDGRYRFIDYDKSEYQDEWTGKGYYKSSAQNAMRVARTETNIAYRRADHERWQQMDFVIGQRIQTAHDHKEKDICDKLKGDYPKDFVFDGWHPQCFCFATPILLDDRYTDSMEDMFLRGEDWEGEIRKRAEEHSIRELPDSFKRWVSENGEKIAASRKRGTEPYFLRENRAAVDGILGKKQSAKVESSIVGKDAAGNPITHEQWYGTPPTGKKPTENAARIEEYKRYRQDPEYRDVVFDQETSGLKATHKDHNFDNDKGWYETSVQDTGMKHGHSVILEKEIHTEYKKRNIEGLWDGMPFEIAGKETATSNNIRDGLKHCAKKPNCEVAILFFPNGNFDEKNFTEGLLKYNGLRKDSRQWTKFKKIICIQDGKIIYEKSHIV